MDQVTKKAEFISSLAMSLDDIMINRIHALESSVRLRLIDDIIKLVDQTIYAEQVADYRELIN